LEALSKEGSIFAPSLLSMLSGLSSDTKDEMMEKTAAALEYAENMKKMLKNPEFAQYVVDRKNV
jgi:hypothetical protein